ncbi:MAG: ABC transporter permease, partial [Sporomusa sp.]
KKKKMAIRLTQVGILVAFLIFWEVGARVGIINSFIMSSPSRIINTFANLSSNGLLNHLWVTLYETLIGFSLGVILGLFIAVLLWWSGFLSKVSEPFLVVLNSLPKIALGPVIIVWVGAGTGAIIFMAVAISLIVTVLEMLNGFKHTNPDTIRMANSFAASKWQTFTKIVFPSNLNTLFNALKVNIGLTMVGVIAGEFLVSKAGLGYLIVYGGQVFKLDLVMASVIILAVLAAILYRLVLLGERLEKRLFHKK